MSIILAAIALLAALFTVFIPFAKWYIKRAKFVRIIERIPGPKAYPIIGTTYLLYGKKRNEIFKRLDENRFKYPRISRVWLGFRATVNIRHADYAEKIVSASKSHLAKAWYYNGIIGQWLGDGLLTSSGAKWHSRRKIITPTFHFSILDGFCNIFADKARIMVDKLAKHAGTGKKIDVYPYITRATLDIIADAAMGTQINAQDETQNDYVKAVHDVARLILKRMGKPWLLVQFIYDMTEDGKQFKECLNILHSFSMDVIQQRKVLRQRDAAALSEDDFQTTLSGKKRLAFLDLLLDESHGLTEEDIREEVDTFMFEGHDTTTAGIAWTLLALGVHPEWQERVHDEMAVIFEGSNRNATVQDLNEMKVLDRVIKETLRLFPSVPFIGRTLSEDVQLGPYTVPAGCTVNIEIQQMHRDAEIFPDPDRFDPDRFLPENAEGRHPFAYIPFSAGARNCIGQKFAVYEEKVILSSIVRNYRFKADGNMEDVDKVFELVLKPIDGILLEFEKRT